MMSSRLHMQVITNLCLQKELYLRILLVTLLFSKWELSLDKIQGCYITQFKSRHLCRQPQVVPFILHTLDLGRMDAPD